ncbi:MULTISPECIES: hypothetical protein [unclassified Pseudomonas]|uniref:hypothetical protein n=1 Tax=unclassified Pseudomonas TaxID=196821 RepID=UPI002AC968AF|nr:MULTISPECIES: hypothetical protein [unclassified Pseudomonas]MEB0041502.1 hypothetical protein [Pseudomonas sp. MH10]MEB0077957.1 hypothetical protein [Pseudomonas sp. MH10out]MEB0093485.1 hypothetical protein [Pseudomonas sp. CCI4.2]MEB0101671.1 hypothetical protein [Pseudomonas sp. CCI3.2]MEB0121889.1 hypothetical protein [Pseudomonas sp. CCI1.2]
MKQWTITYVDKDGVKQSLELEREQRPSNEDAADYLREVLFPIADKLDLNDLDGRAPEPTVKSLKAMHSVQILTVTEAS